MPCTALYVKGPTFVWCSRHNAVHDFTIHGTVQCMPSLFTCLHYSRHSAVHDFTIHVPSLFKAQCSVCLHCSRHSEVMQCMPSLFTAQGSAWLHYSRAFTIRCLHCSRHSAVHAFSIHGTMQCIPSLFTAQCKGMPILYSRHRANFLYKRNHSVNQFLYKKNGTSYAH